MYKLILLAGILFFSSCRATTYYIVRHSEKASPTTITPTTMSSNMMTSDVPLSEAGKQRAEALKNMLRKENIRHIFSTNYVRTKSTVQPLADAIGVPVEIYDTKDSGFANRLQSLSGNVLIVGHSNTVDDLVNELTGKKELTDLPDSAFGDLFIVKKKGQHFTFERKHFGQ